VNVAVVVEIIRGFVVVDVVVVYLIEIEIM
jgi:hypothetical protein